MVRRPVRLLPARYVLFVPFVPAAAGWLSRVPWLGRARCAPAGLPRICGATCRASRSKNARSLRRRRSIVFASGSDTTGAPAPTSAYSRRASREEAAWMRPFFKAVAAGSGWRSGRRQPPMPAFPYPRRRPIRTTTRSTGCPTPRRGPNDLEGKLEWMYSATPEPGNLPSTPARRAGRRARRARRRQDRPEPAGHGVGDDHRAARRDDRRARLGHQVERRGRDGRPAQEDAAEPRRGAGPAARPLDRGRARGRAPTAPPTRTPTTRTATASSTSSTTPATRASSATRQRAPPPATRAASGRPTCSTRRTC